MNIPHDFKKILEQDEHLFSSVMSTMTKYGQIISESNCEFFRGYTKHDVSHFERVFQTAEAIVSEQTLQVLEPIDVTIILLSVLLHDLGMHLTADGFETLLKGTSSQRIDQIDSTSWQEEWNRFYDEAKRWGDKRKIDVFGQVIDIPELISNKNEITDYHRMLYGEFIRRHHPRLAHEIARFGFPGANSIRIPFADELDYYLRDLSGVIARSHGSNLREYFSYIRDNHGDIRIPYRAKAVFWMVVLRIADYLHITSDRAPSLSLEIRSVSSPFSRHQWEIHEAVRYTHNNHEDPETLFVQAHPQNSTTLLDIKDLLSSIQNELDVSWAVMGEVYGRYPEGESLKLKIRRIQSNLDDKRYIDNLPFVADRITFSYDPDLMKLLVAPLYGDNPSYGVRELIQNAVDACREKEFVCKRDNIPYSPEVNVNIFRTSPGEVVFRISDNGIGMTRSTLINYFLRAGASFRKSQAWQDAFIDSQGNPSVNRSGKFGIGVLASFLIGDSIKVSTRHADDLTGYKFTAHIHSNQIEIEKEEMLSEGTTIEIIMRDTTVRELRRRSLMNSKDSNLPAWDQWYKLSNPNVSITADKELMIRVRANTPIDAALLDWNTIYPDGYSQVDWSFTPKHSSLICNGIVVPGGYKFSSNLSYPDFMSNQVLPSVIITDPKGYLPLTLNRNNLDGGHLPFEDELKEEICKDIIACLLMLEKPTRYSGNFFEMGSLSLKYPLWSKHSTSARRNVQENDLIFSKNGYTIAHSYTVTRACSGSLTLIVMKSDTDVPSFTLGQENPMYMFLKADLGTNALKKRLYEEHIVVDAAFPIKAKRVFIPNPLYEYLFDSSAQQRLRGDFKNAVRPEQAGDNWVCLQKGNPPVSDIQFSLLEDYDNCISIVIENYLDKFQRSLRFNSSKNFIFAKLLERYFGDDVLIPYELEERKKKFGHAFDELEPYMRKYSSAFD